MTYIATTRIKFPNDVIATGTSEGAINIHDLDNHRKTLTERFLFFTGTSELLTVAASSGDTSITVANGATFAIGNEIRLCEGNVCEVDALTITGIATNLLTLDRPIDNNYTTAASAEIVSGNAAVSGTLTSPAEFIVKPPANENWHIDRMLIVGTDGNTMDDGTFIGIPALTNGVVLREVRARGTRVIGNWKTNGDIRLDCYDVQYTAKAPAGANGMNARYTFKNYDVIIELDGADGDYLEILVQDDLSGNTSFSLKAEGHFAGPSFA